MAEAFSPQIESTISLQEVLRSLAPLKWMLLSGAVLGAIAGFALSSVVTPVYRSEVTMLPTKSPESSNGGGGIAGQVGGLAALAGLNLQAGGDSQVASAEYLRSKTLVRRFIEAHDLMPQLYPGRWNPSTRVWTPSWRGEIPTETTAVRLMRNNVVKVSEDKRSGLLTVTFDWKDPSMAATLANEFVRLANDGLRRRAIADAQSTIDYLNAQLEKTQTVETRSAVSRIIETQLRNLTLAQAREDYAFRVIDAAVDPDRADLASPKKPIYLLVGLISGAWLFGWRRSLTLRRRHAQS